jgi:hypothetical protein
MWKEVVAASLRLYPNSCLRRLRKIRENSGYPRFESDTLII